MRCIWWMCLTMGLAGCGAVDPQSSQPGPTPSGVGSRPPAQPVPITLPQWFSEIAAFGAQETGARQLADALGQPSRRRAVPIENRHIPGQTDSIVSVEYGPHARADYYKVTGGPTFLSSLSLFDSRALAPFAVNVGASWDQVLRSFGDPSGNESGVPYFVNPDPGPVEQALFVLRADTVREIRVFFYVD